MYKIETYVGSFGKLPGHTQTAETLEEARKKSVAIIMEYAPRAMVYIQEEGADYCTELWCAERIFAKMRQHEKDIDWMYR